MKTKRWMLSGGLILASISLTAFGQVIGDSEHGAADSAAEPAAWHALHDAEATPTAADTSVMKPTMEADEDLGDQSAKLDRLLKELDQIKAELETKADREEPEEDDGWVEVSNNPWTHKVGGRVVMENVTWLDDIDGRQQNYSEIRQIRLEMSGRGYGVLDYKVQVDFEPEVEADGKRFGSVGMKDAYLGMHDIPLLGYVRIGHYKVAFSHDQILSRKNMTFMERNPMSDPAGFTPGREVGLAAFNYSDDLSRTWSFGGYLDSISEVEKQRIDDNQGFLANGRYTWLPFYDEPSNGRYLVHLGVAGIYTHTQDDSGRFRQRPEIHEGDRLIDTGAIDANDYWVLGTEALVQWGSFYAFNEFMYTQVNEIGDGQRDLYSGYAEIGYRLTGEHRSYNRQGGYFGGMNPHTNFWWVDGTRGLGAWEIAARYSFVDFTDSPNQSEYESFAFALNWYWNPRTKLQLNWINPHTKGAPFGDDSGSILAMRVAAFF